MVQNFSVSFLVLDVGDAYSIAARKTMAKNC